jgi:CDGSH-type Zn-finger protein
MKQASYMKGMKREGNMYTFEQLTPDQQFRATYKAAVDFLTDLCSGNASFCDGTLQKIVDTARQESHYPGSAILKHEGCEKAVEANARAIAEDTLYSEKDVRTYLADWSSKNV